jgi:hypothetical protein
MARCKRYEVWIMEVLSVQVSQNRLQRCAARNTRLRRLRERLRSSCRWGLRRCDRDTFHAARALFDLGDNGSGRTMYEYEYSDGLIVPMKHVNESGRNRREGMCGGKVASRENALRQSRLRTQSRKSLVTGAAARTC